MRGLSSLAHQLLEERLRLVAEPQPFDGPAAQFEQPKAERVLAGLAVPPDEPVLIQHLQEPVDRALVERETLGHLASAELPGVVREGLKDVDRALEHLNAIVAPLFRTASHRASPLSTGHSATSLTIRQPVS